MDIIGGTSAPADLVAENTKEFPFGLIAGIFAISIIVLIIIISITIEIKDKNNKNKSKKETNSICPICGEPSETHSGEPRQDKLCPCHAAMLRDDQIALCKYCGSWYNTSETCKCRKID